MLKILIINPIMAKKKRRSRKKKQGFSWKRLKKDDRVIKLLGISLILIGIYLAIAFSSYMYTWKVDQDKVLQFSWSILWRGDLVVTNWLGRLGAVVSNMFFYWGFGLPSVLLVLAMLKLGLKVLKKQPLKPFWDWFQTVFLVVMFSAIVLEFIFPHAAFPWGGAFGESSCIWLSNFIGQIGLGFLLAFSVAAFIVWNLNPDFRNFQLAVPGASAIHLPQWNWVQSISEKFHKTNFRSDASSAETVTTLRPKNRPVSDDAEFKDSIYGEGESSIEFDTPEIITKPKAPSTTTDSETELEIHLPGEENNEVSAPDKSIIEQNDVHAVPMEPVLHIKEENRFHSEPYDPTKDLSSFEYPGLELLRDYSDQKIEIDRAELEAKKDKIIETLLHYKIEITKIRATIGPTVTLYEIVPAPGNRISKIKGLEDDIALNLSALGIRIIAPIPGKGTIGIEVPNKKRQVVSLKEVLKSDKFKNAKMDLPIALGKTISNEVFVADLAKMPHLLVAGATGQGKSVGINTVLMSLLYKKHPSQIKFVLIDPKKVELPIYNEISKHYLAYLPNQTEPIVTETEKVIYTLNSLVIEMDQRYDLLKKARARNIKEYNEKFTKRQLNPNNGHRFMPFIVLVIDEFADLIMTAGKEIELPIGRLAQLARAVGIHLIIATQRPSVKVVTGLIKANFPARIAFRVTSNVDSRTIMDHGGAEQLIGRGDMLLAAGSEVVRLQCAFVDTPEVEAVTKFIGEQQGYPEPYYLPEYEGEQELAGTDLKPSDLDSMFEEAARLVVQQQHGSTSMIQRRLKLGYNRAGRIMDQLEMLRIVGPSEGSKPREVYVFSEMELDHILKSIFDNQ